MTAQHDPELCGPVRLAAPRVLVVRLSRRILYVIGAKTLVEAELEGPAARARAARRRGGAVRCDGVRGSVWDGTRKRR